MGKKQQIYLRLMEVEDTDKIVEWRNKDFVRRNFIYQDLFTREGHLSWIRNQVDPGHVVQFVICLPGGREIGSTYLRDIDRDAGTAEYGMFIGEEDALGHGYGTAAASMTLEYAFHKMHLSKVFMRFLSDNIGSRISCGRAGFCLTEKKETVRTLRGEQEVRFMESDPQTWKTAKAAEVSETEES